MTIPNRIPNRFKWALFLIFSLSLTAAVYWPGLSGDFLFDDHPHIVRNGLLQIDGLSLAELHRAWNSSFFSFPASRPLAMLTFGVNHAFSGLDPFAFKLTNLVLHLVTGVVLFFVAQRIAVLFLLLEKRPAKPNTVAAFAWLAMTLWLVHPMNLSPVLLSVQRMTILSALFASLGILAYLYGRSRLTNGNRVGLVWVWASPIFAVIGALSKENALLLPLLLLVTEWTLFQWRGLAKRDRNALVWFFVAVVAAPFIVVITYLMLNPGYLSYSGRPFTLEERILTETRVLWSYVRLLLAPDIGAMGLVNDDFTISRSLIAPWTTFIALIGWILAAGAALMLRRRTPLLSYAILFFLAGHLLESSIIALELVFEHRNYLPAFGLFLGLAAIPTINAPHIPVRKELLRALFAMTVVAFSGMTLLRAQDWSSEEQLIIRELEQHPDSPRANFRFAQLLMSLPIEELKEEARQVAKVHLQRVRELDPEHADGLFGLIVLELQQNRLPPRDVVEALAVILRRVPFSPLKVTTDHFPYLVRIAQKEGQTAILPREHIHLLFDAALANPTLPPAGRAIIYNSLRAYYLVVLRDVDGAIGYARLAVQAIPTVWSPHDRLVRLLAAVHRWDEAEEALRAARESDRLGIHADDADELAGVIAAARRGEPILVSPPGKDI